MQSLETILLAFLAQLLNVLVSFCKRHPYLVAGFVLAVITVQVWSTWKAASEVSNLLAKLWVWYDGLGNGSKLLVFLVGIPLGPALPAALTIGWAINRNQLKAPNLASDQSGKGEIYG